MGGICLSIGRFKYVLFELLIIKRIWDCNVLLMLLKIIKLFLIKKKCNMNEIKKKYVFYIIYFFFCFYK